jgi:hypothetical protein
MSVRDDKRLRSVIPSELFDYMPLHSSQRTRRMAAVKHVPFRTKDVGQGLACISHQNFGLR